MSESIFQYRPLDPSCANAFRILELFPGQFDDPLAGTLEHYDLDYRIPAYEAVSYVWGQRSSTDFISLDEAGAHIPITSSLATLLRYIRTPETKRILWIDQLCINQQDDCEKSQQVGMMGNIYGFASQVLVWLGEASLETPLAMRFLDQLINGRVSKPWRRFHLPTLKVGLGHVLGSNWFSRLWVVQESGLSRETTLICGNNSVGWPSDVHYEIGRRIMRLKFAECHPDLLEMVTFKPLIDVLQQQFKVTRGDPRHARMAFLDLMYEYRDRKCTDLRDRVYGILGLAEREGCGIRFHPDYSLSIEETFDRLEKRLFQGYQSTQLDDLPSEPDWHGEAADAFAK